MEADIKRKIKSGKEFDHLFPPPSGKDIRVKGTASVEDTLKLIRKTVPLTLWHTEKITKHLKGRTLNETCSNIWHFVYEHIQYKRDEDGVEQVRSPRRTWWERRTGVDCDCYTEFISSILLNLGIPHKARITKYPKLPPEVARWQHIYPIVPKNGQLDYKLEDREDYIVIDCVKNEYDDEQPFLEYKDYDMKLDYLDGIDEEIEEGQEDFDWPEPDSVDVYDLQTVDEELLGSIFSKIGKGLKKVVKKVGTGVKAAAKTVGKVAKKVGDKVGDGIRFINRYVNPATILLRNGFLLAMKVNLMNVAGRLRFAYLSDTEAQKRGMNMDSLKKLRSVKDRAETVYWQAGGKKANLKKAILKGKGNKDKKVPLSGLAGIDDDVYMDMDEYRIIHSDPDDLQGLGELASGAAITAASGAVAAIAASLKQIKELFGKGGSDEQAFQSETDNAGTAASASATIPEDEDAMVIEYGSDPQQSPTSEASYSAPTIKQEVNTANQETTYETQAEYSDAKTTSESDQSSLPDSASIARSTTASSSATQTGSSLPATTGDQNAQGFMEKTTAWVKQNPGKSLLVAGAVLGSGLLLVKVMQGGANKNANGMSGLPGKSKKKRKKNKARNKIQSITL